MSPRGSAALPPLRERLAHELVVALLTRQIHGSDSSYYRDSLQQARDTLRTALGTNVHASLALAFDPAGVWAGAHLLLAASLQGDPLVGPCREREVTHIVFRQGVTTGELGRCLDLIVGEEHRAAFAAAPVLARALAAHGIRHIDIGLRDAPPGRTVAPAPRGVRAYRSLTSVLQDSHVAGSRGEQLEIDRAAVVVEQAIRDMDVAPSRLLMLAGCDDLDSFTVGHSVRVALLALLVGRAAGLARSELVTLGTAALLHDVGKSRIPQEILFKHGRLDPDEWQVMAQHPRLGAEILIEQPEVDPRAIGAAFCHHMTPEQQGYPRPLVPFEPSAISRLVRVCDVFEALTAARPYKKALTALHAYTIMARCQGDFDPAWLRYFTQTVGIFPLGTRVELTDGRTALVVGQTADLRRPRVRPWSDLDDPTAADDDADSFEIGSEIEGAPTGIAAVLGTGCDRTDVIATLENMHCGLSPAGARCQH